MIIVLFFPTLPDEVLEVPEVVGEVQREEHLYIENEPNNKCVEVELVRN